MKKVRVIKHFDIGDELFEFDYRTIDLEIDGEVVATYSYNDCGAERINGYLDCLDVYENFEVEYKYVSDIDPYC